MTPNTRLATPIAVLATALLTACGADPPAEPDTVRTPVRVTPVEAAAMESSIRTVGTLEPADDVRLSFKTGGVIASISVEQGARVRAGQQLAALAQQEVAASVAQARALAAKAARDLERGRALFADEVVSREQLEDLTTASEVASATLRAAEFNARFSRIIAPADGVVLRRLAEPDELVAAGQPVLVLGVTSGGWVVSATLADRDIVRTRVGDAATVTFDAFPGKLFPATVAELASAADPRNGTYEMKLTVDPAGERFVQGLVAKVEMTHAASDALHVIPVQSLLEADGSRAVVYVVASRDDGEVAQRVDVRLGRMSGERIEILEGLDGSERVVTEGAAYLRDGQAVRIIAGS